MCQRLLKERLLRGSLLLSPGNDHTQPVANLAFPLIVQLKRASRAYLANIGNFCAAMGERILQRAPAFFWNGEAAFILFTAGQGILLRTCDTVYKLQ